MTLEKPLITKEEMDAIAKETGNLGKYRTVLRKGILNEEARTLIPLGIKYRIYGMTLKENRNQLDKFRDDLVLRDLSQTGQGAGALLTDADDIREFREFVLKEVVARASDLLDNNFYVRMHAVNLLAELDLTEADTRKRTPLVAYTPAMVPLLKVVKDPDQPEAVKISAVRGLTRILELGTTNIAQRIEIAQALTTELLNADYHYWYQMRVANALAYVNTLEGADRKPRVAHALATALADPKRHWMVRAEAARSLGRVPLDAQINIDLIAHQIVQLGREMAAAYNENKNALYWKSAFWKLYLAFQPNGDYDKKTKAGLLTKVQSQSVRDAYAQVLPFAKTALSGGTIAPDSIQAAEEWLQKNKPNNTLIHPSLEPITTVQDRSQLPMTAEARRE